jgi:hypothetical protein
MPTVNLAAEDAMELGEMLRFLNYWLLASDHDHLEASLRRYVGHPATSWTGSGPTWPGSPSCSATTPTANSSRPPRRSSSHPHRPA